MKITNIKIILVGILLFLPFVFFFFNLEIDDLNKECLKSIGKDICEKEGYIYGGYNYYYGSQRVFCNNGKRVDADDKQVFFSKEELNSCKIKRGYW